MIWLPIALFGDDLPGTDHGSGAAVRPRGAGGREALSIELDAATYDEADDEVTVRWTSPDPGHDKNALVTVRAAGLPIAVNELVRVSGATGTVTVGWPFRTPPATAVAAERHDDGSRGPRTTQAVHEMIC